MTDAAALDDRPGGALAAYLDEVTSAPCIRFCAERSGVPHARVHQLMADYASEVVFGASVLRPMALSGRRVLEVGAGLGLLGIWLQRQGVALVMLEPGAGGFGENARLIGAVREWLKAPEGAIIDAPAQALDPSRHGRFDVVFSINVLEHIRDVERALDAMLGVLAADGLMRHTCPNYTVPYDPHYAMPLVPLAPHATAVLVSRIRNEEVWQSLNFITYGRVVRFCMAHGLEYEFDRGLLLQAFERIERDPAFRARRGRVSPLVYRLLKHAGLLGLVGRLPPRWATPMTFSCWRR